VISKISDRGHLVGIARQNDEVNVSASLIRWLGTNHEEYSDDAELVAFEGRSNTSNKILVLCWSKPINARANLLPGLSDKTGPKYPNAEIQIETAAELYGCHQTPTGGWAPWRTSC